MPVLFLIVLVDMIGFGLIIPLLPFYAERFRASPIEVTLLLAVFSLAQLVTAPLWGRLSDRVGRRPVLMVSLFASFLSYGWMGCGGALWVLFAARALAGACAGNISAAQAYVADVTTPETRARGMGMLGAAFGLGFVIGPAIGGFLGGRDPAHVDIALPAFVAAGLAALAFLGAAFLLRESLSLADRASAWRRGRLAATWAVLHRPVLSRLILVFLIMSLAFAAMESTFALWTGNRLGWGPRQVGMIFAYVGIVMVAIQGGLIGRLAARFGEERLMVTGFALIAAGLALLPLSSGLPMLIVAVSGLAIGMGVMSPSVNSLISRRAGPAERGEVMGVAQSAGSLARVLGPAAAGPLFTHLGPDAPFLFGAALAVVALLLAAQTLRDAGGRESAPQAPLPSGSAGA